MLPWENPHMYDHTTASTDKWRYRAERSEWFLMPRQQTTTTTTTTTPTPMSPYDYTPLAAVLGDMERREKTNSEVLIYRAFDTPSWSPVSNMRHNITLPSYAQRAQTAIRQQCSVGCVHQHFLSCVKPARTSISRSLASLISFSMAMIACRLALISSFFAQELDSVSVAVVLCIDALHEAIMAGRGKAGVTTATEVSQDSYVCGSYTTRLVVGRSSTRS